MPERGSTPQGLPLRGRSPLGQLLQSSQVLDSGPLGVTRRALRPADTVFQRFQYFSGASRFCYAVSAVAEIDGLTSLSWSFDAAARRARIVQVLSVGWSCPSEQGASPRICRSVGCRREGAVGGREMARRLLPRWLCGGMRVEGVHFGSYRQYRNHLSGQEVRRKWIR